ncbi:MAG: hypothetical protein M1834_006162 [Cirrosporium novae-zelandiae]|nr:MAG: hypothetical protein M1834_006162 [Cirrosporium novae-zelandiae]
MSSTVLADRSTNSPTKKPLVDAKPMKGDGPKSMEYHRQMLQARLAEQREQPPAYISPSDDIMSPCTKKLSAYKDKQLKKARPNSLFAKASSNSANNARGKNLFANIRPSSNSNESK